MGYALRRIRLRGGNFRLESVATLPWNERQLCDGISGNFAVESMATFVRNQWQLWCGIGGNFRAEYADYPTEQDHLLACSVICHRMRLSRRRTVCWEFLYPVRPVPHPGIVSRSDIVGLAPEKDHLLMD